MLDGKLWNELSLKSNSLKEIKLPMSFGIVLFDKLQLFRRSVLKAFKPCKEEGSRIEFGYLVGEIQDQKAEGNDLDGGPLHPHRDRYLSFFSFTIVEGIR